MCFAQRRKLHRALAEWFERTYAADLSSFYPLLAYHWCQVVEAEEAEPELIATAIDYLEKAGEQALGNANREAIDFFKQALALDTRLEVRSDRLQRARWERQLGEAYYGLGNLAECQLHLTQALLLLGHQVASTPQRTILSILSQAVQQGLHRLWPVRFLSASSDSDSASLEAARAHILLTRVYYLTDKLLPFVASVLSATNLAERKGSSPELAHIYALMSVTCGHIPLHPLARAYGRWAQKTAQNVNDLPAQAYVLEVTGLYYLGIGHWDAAKNQLGQAAKLWERFGNWRFYEESLSLLGHVTHYHQGEFTHSAKLFTSVYASAHRRGDAFSQLAGLLGQVQSGLRLAHSDLLEDAMSSLEEAKRLSDEISDFLHEDIGVYALFAHTYLLRGQPQRAQQAAQKTLALIMQTSFIASYGIDGYDSPAEVYLALWESSHDQSPPEQQALVKGAQQACKILHKFARIFPICKPRAWLRQGLYDWLSGKHRKAHKAWQKSLAQAQKLDMSYDEGLARYEIGRHLPVDNPARQEHLNRAAEIFTRLEATYDLSRARGELDKARSVGNG